MDSRPDSRTALAAVVATLLSAAAWWAGSSLQPLWWAAWLAPLPLLRTPYRLWGDAFGAICLALAVLLAASLLRRQGRRSGRD